MNRKEHEARKRGECLVAFLREEPVIHTLTLLREYLELRNVQRYRITEILGGVLVVELPPHKLRVLDDVAARRPIDVAWMVAELPWWYIGRRLRTWKTFLVH